MRRYVVLPSINYFFESSKIITLKPCVCIFDYCQVFTWYGATIEMDGVTETDYTADEVYVLVSFSTLPSEQ